MLNQTEIDETNIKASSGQKSGNANAFTITMTICAIWGFVATFLFTAPTAIRYVEASLIALSNWLSIPVPVIIISALFALYMSLAALLVQSRSGRRALRRINNTLNIFALKSEKSFYAEALPNTVTATAAVTKSIIGAALEAAIGRSVPSQPSAQSSIAPEQDWEGIKDAATQATIDRLSNEVAAAIAEQAAQDRLNKIWKGSLSRLSDQTSVLGSRANLTLWMGIVFCIAGLIVLWLSFFSSYATEAAKPPEGMEWVELAKSYAPRLTLVILIEIIGFFFLKMYRATLSEIRYVQNEITNVEMRILALYSSISEAASTLPTIVEILAKTDRNSIIDKNQTTVEIEKQRASADADKSVYDAVATILHGTDKASFWQRSRS